MGSKPEVVKENYRLLREAGYSPAQARKMRCYGREKIRELLAAQGVELEEPVREENLEVRQPVRGNKARRLAPDESALLDKLRAAGISPADVEVVLIEQWQTWVDRWDQMLKKGKAPGVAVMREKLAGQLAALRGIQYENYNS